jgi:hypothetical protein
MTIAVELTRAVDGPEVLAMLEAAGVDASLSEDGCELVASADDCETVAHLLEAWAEAREIPFSPVQVDGCSFVLAPPAG